MPPSKRKSGNRLYRKLFLISAEGTETEPQYFTILNKQYSMIGVHNIKKKGTGSKNSPEKVLALMQDYLRKKKPHPPYEAWLVVDRDEWDEDLFTKLDDWAKENDNYGFVLSNPKFEYWLLLHFENGNNITRENCIEHLKRHLPTYDKRVDPGKITNEKIDDAIRHAQQHDNPPCADWPHSTGTTVYKLVENIRKADLEGLERKKC